MTHETQAGAVNRLTIGGTLMEVPQTRVSPAGIPVSRFTLEHRSQQTQAGMMREARCRIVVTAAGDALQETVRRLRGGSQVRITGFLARSDYRSAETHLVLHADTIDVLD